MLTVKVATRSTAWFCGRSLSGIAGSNPAVCMIVCLLWVLCVEMQRSLCRTDHSSRGVLPRVECLNATAKPWKWGGPKPPGLAAPRKKLMIFCTERFKKKILTGVKLQFSCKFLTVMYYYYYFLRILYALFLWGSKDCYLHLGQD